MMSTSVRLSRVLGNVGGLEDLGACEIRVVDEVIPGYFWLFPVGDVVVGIGMLISEEKDERKG